MFRRLATLVICIGAVAAAPARVPVLVELFTSEGCSSCPPADRLLEQIDPQAVVLSEHVDYWDHQGWKDPYSSHALTQRQEDYARRFRIDGAYTPQMVVDGETEFNGSDGSRASQEIARAATRSKASVRITRLPEGLRVEVAGAPRAAGVFLAIAENSGASNVTAGENNGRRLQHIAILRSLRKLGSVKKGGSFSQIVPAVEAAQRTVVFVQEPEAGPISGAAVLLPGP
jgi:hypothetical protein